MLHLSCCMLHVQIGEAQKGTPCPASEDFICAFSYTLHNKNKGTDLDGVGDLRSGRDWAKRMDRNGLGRPAGQ